MAMETRKLQKVGGGTYTVSIPKAWADKHGLEVGEDVHIYTHRDGSIVLRSGEKDGGMLDRVTLEVEGDEPKLVTRSLRALHVIGFEHVTLTPKDHFTAEQRRAARRAKQDLVGTEVLVERENEISVQNLLDTADISVRQSVVQLKFIVLSVHREVLDAYVEGNKDAIDRINDQVAEADRILDLITRHFNRAMVSLEEVDLLGISRPVLFEYYATAVELQRIAHLTKTIASLINQQPAPVAAEIEPDLRSVAEATLEFIDQSVYAVLRSDDIGTAHDALTQGDGLSKQLTSIESGPDYAADEELINLIETLILMVDHGGRIAEISLLAAIRAQYL